MNTEKRLRQYRRYLSRDRKYKKTLYSLVEKNELSTDDKLFVHSFAPILVNYVEWVLDNAQKNSIKRLYFLARDGYLMYHLAQRIVKKRGMDIELRYLKVSRYSLRMAQYQLLKEKSLELICVAGIDITFHKLMKRAKLTEEEIEEIAGLCGYGDRIHRVLTYSEIMQLKKKLYRIPRLLEYIDAHSANEYPIVVGYLKQEGLMQDISYALVDSGWIGTMQQSIEQLVKSVRDGVTIDGYYFGLYSVPEKTERKRYHTYFFSPEKGLMKKVHFSNCLFEAMFSAPEGMTTGYRDEERIQPIDNTYKNPDADRIAHTGKLLDIYLEEYLKIDDKQCYTGLKGCKQILRDCMSKPIYEEAKLYGSYRFCDDLIDGNGSMVAARLTADEIKNHRFIRKLLIKLGIIKSRIVESAWLEGSIVLNGKGVRLNLWHARLYKLLIYIRKALKK